MLIPLIGLVLGCARASAQTPPNESRDGISSDGLPALERVALARTGPVGSVGLGADLGYGLTEGVLDQGESHHRGALRLGAGVVPIAALGLGLELEGRYHRQAGGSDGGDDGLLVRSRFGARVAARLSPRLSAGAQLQLQLAAAESFGDALAGTSPELDLLATYDPSTRWVLGARAGFRWDRAEEAVDNPAGLSGPDRLALDIADGDALPLGVGVEHRLDRLSLFGEWSWEPRVGEGAQKPLQAPMWLTAGARLFLSRMLEWRASLSVSPSGRPDDAADPASLSAVEPRLWLRTGLSVHLEPARRPPPLARAPVVAPPAAVPAPPPARVQGRVSRSDGVPLEAATVQVQVGETTRQATTDHEGRFVLEGLAPGRYGLTITAEGYRPLTHDVELGGEQLPELALTLERALPEGHIRGQIKSFSGTGVVAHVRIDPLGLELDSDAEGRFDVDVPPGEYSVSVSAPRHVTQQRPAVVEQNGVTVLIIELRRDRTQ